MKRRELNIGFVRYIEPLKGFVTMTSLPSGSISWTLDENKEFGLCNMQVPLECSVPCEKNTFPPHSVAQETSSPFSETECFLETIEISFLIL